MAMAHGDGASMWPLGISSVQDCPMDLVMAISHATNILRSQENLMEDEHPPMWKWAFEEEIELHFERVKRKRDERFGGKPKEEHDEPPTGWAQNELARNLR